MVRYNRRPLMTAVLSLAVLLLTSAAFAAKKTDVTTTKGRTFEECQKLAHERGGKWMGSSNGRHFQNPTNPNAKGFMGQCMRGEI